jgi:hypothetical protein
MSVTIIDRLVVELGLDPTLFKKGTKEADNLTKKTAQDVSQGTKSMISDLRKVAIEFGALFLAVRSFKDVVGFMERLQDSTRQLGVDARNTGESAATLKDLGNAAEVVGGKAQDATDTVLGLQKAIFNAQHGLGYSDQLVEFNRLGVDTGANSGELRPIVDVLREVTQALEQQYPDSAKRFQETQVLGLQGGIAQLVSKGVKEFDRLIAEQKSIPQVTQGQTDAAQRLHESYAVLTERIEAIARQVLTAVEPALEHLFKGIGDYLQKHTGDISKGIESLLGWFSGDGPQHVVDGLVAIGDAAVTVAEFLSKLFPGTASNKAVPGVGAAPYFSGAFTKAEKDFELKPGILGSKQLQGNTLGGLTATAETLQRLHYELGGDTGDPDWSHTLNAFQQRYTDPSKRAKPSLWERQSEWFDTQGPLNLGGVQDAPRAAAGAESSPAARAMVSEGKPTTDTGTRGPVTLSIDTLNVNGVDTNNVERVGGSIAGTLERKLSVTYADTALS